MESNLKLFVSCAIGLEPVLADEMRLLSAEPTLTKAGVHLDVDLETAYRVILWSRVASRVLLPLFETNATGDDLYAEALEFDWSEHLRPGSQIAVEFSGQNKHIRHTRYGALRIKDAIADWFSARDLEAPQMSREEPDMRLSARLNRGQVEVALDLSGGAMHRRGYRERQGQAPLRENLAAALLFRAGWPKVCAAGGSLFDPMCGSGTFLIEAAMMATDCAPGLRRDSWGFQHWPNHDVWVWGRLVKEAEDRFSSGRANYAGSIIGADSSGHIVRMARDNASRAAVGELVTFKTENATSASALDVSPGLIITNPPYGERMGDEEQVALLYEAMGSQLREKFCGWKAAILSVNAEYGRRLGMHSHKQYKISNGKLACLLLMFEIENKNFLTKPKAVTPSDGAMMVANRIKKNQSKLNSWLAAENVTNYRVYDADIPEYSAAVDIYQTNAGRYAVVQEYAPPKMIDSAKARHRLNELITGVSVGLTIESQAILVKSRERQRGSNQYRRADDRSANWLTVKEGNANLEINLEDYLDTGLFLDHRPIRREIRQIANGKRFLNLFCYTAVVTVQAVLGGAKSSLSLDMSNTYLDWAERNFEHNNIDQKKHHLERTDCVEWLAKQSVFSAQKFDLIFLDPPSFSNSKKMETTLDIQRDHAELIAQSMKLLEQDGLLIFSTNLRKFRMDTEVLSDFELEDYTDQTLDPDFQRNSRIHQCWKIRHKHES